MNNDFFGSWLRQFSNDLQSREWFAVKWKSLVNQIMSDQKIITHIKPYMYFTSYILFYALNMQT